MKITGVGLGYVGSTLAVMLSGHHDIYALDKDKSKVDAINSRQSVIQDSMMDRLLQAGDIKLTATTDPNEAFADADFIVIATDTNLDEEKGVLDTSSIERVVAIISACRGGKYEENPVIVIKSTVPTGYTESLSKEYSQFGFIFCPEFLREKTAMHDVLHPNRIIIGFDDARMPGSDGAAQKFADILTESVEKQDVPVLFTSTAEAEAIKLFSNSYLAMRVAFFNELDTFAKTKGLDTERIIQGVSLDPRIGDYYNTPSPGFGGHCLPKDTRQLIADFGEQPELLIRAAVDANELRKEFTQKHDS